MSETARRALVTGGTDGIGRETALVLAAGGFEVVIVGRDPDKGARAEREIRGAAGHDRVWFEAADLSRVREAERLAGRVSRRWDSLHALVHAAGGIRFAREVTDEGVERNLALHYLSRFALTRRLIPGLEAGGMAGRAARVVFAGGAARGGRVPYDDPAAATGFNVVRSVMQYQHANDVLTVELGRRLARADRPPAVTAACLKLGPVRTGMHRSFPWWARALVAGVLLPLVGRPAGEVGRWMADLATDPRFESRTGSLYELVTRFQVVTPEPRVSDPGEGLRLWEWSDRLCDAIGANAQRLSGWVSRPIVPVASTSSIL